MRKISVSIGILAFFGCGTESDDVGDAGVTCAQFQGACVEIEPGDTEGLLEEANLAEDGSTIVLKEGTWVLSNQVTFRSAENLTLIGQGIDKSILNFA